jgi:PAS domain S-box-containing protein
MEAQANGEILRLRTALRDLVAVSTLPVAWVGRHPRDIAAGLADVLIGSLQLDFVFVRLCEPTRSTAVEVTRGDAWKSFSDWLERHLAVVRWLSRREIVPDVGGGAEPCRGLVVPIGVDGEGGLVAAACARSDFPDEVDLLLLSVAANHAATAFQSALAEQDLRQVRSELETKVAERTAELRRTSTELQTILDASPVGIALFGTDQAVQRCNPAFERILGWKADEIAGHTVSLIGDCRDRAGSPGEALRGGDNVAQIETRLVRKDGTEFDAAVLCAPLTDEAGSAAGFVGTIEDVSKRKRFDEERERLLAAERTALADAVAAQRRFGDLVNSVEGIVWEACPPGFRFSFVSKQAERTLGYPVGQWLSEPTFWADHLHPDDREWAVRFRLTAVEEKRDHDFEYRLVAADGRVVWVRDMVTVVVQGDRATGLRGVMLDITERKRAEAERHAHLWFFESLDRINRAIQGTNDLERMMSDVLAEVLSILGCDRAWLVYPCDPEATSWGVRMEHTRPEFPGAFVLGRDVPSTPGIIEAFRAVRASDGPVRFGPGCDLQVPPDVARRFSIRSQIAMAIRPKGDRPYMFGLHQCSYPRVWTQEEERLFQEIGRRFGDALTSLLIFRNLRESEARLEAAQRIAHVGYWERDLQTNRITWSDETCRIFGLVPGARQLDLGTLRDAIHPEDRERVLRASAEAVRGGPRYDVEYRAVRPNGEVRNVHSQGDVTRDESGPPRIFGIVEDITERRRAEAEVRESERRYRYIFQSAGVSIWEADFSAIKEAIDELKSIGVGDFREYCGTHPEFVERAIAMMKIADVNDTTRELFAVASKDELLASPQNVLLPETIETVAGVLIAIAEGRTSFQAESVLQTLKGERLAVLFTITFPPTGRYDSVLLTMMDITERKRAEYLTAQVFDSLPDRVSIVGRDYRYRRVNPAFERNWRRPADTVIGRHMADVVGTEMFGQIKPRLDRCFAGEDVSCAEWFSSVPTRQFLAMTFSPRRPDANKVDAALVIARDLTDHMHASEALRQAQTDLAHISRVTTMGELTASLAHEINQPIAAAVTNANACLRWLARARPDVEEAHQAASRMIKDATRAADIISRIRLLFRKGATPRELVDVNEVIQEMVVLLRTEATRYAIPIRAELSAELPRVKADRVQLQQVFMNLMLNGIEAMKDMKEPGQLTVRSERTANDQLLISVTDTGVGLPPQQADQIFDAFFSTKPNGTGMGLPISRSIIESHGGRLWAAGNCGPGATFHFTLPPENEAHP